MALNNEDQPLVYWIFRGYPDHPRIEIHTTPAPLLEQSLNWRIFSFSHTSSENYELVPMGLPL